MPLNLLKAKLINKFQMPSANDGIMVILSSPSGAGKTTLVNLLSKKDNFEISISHTTRKPREGEIPNKDYYFVNDNEFKSVLLSDNTESNKKDKLEKIYIRKNIKTLDISHKLYEIFNKKEMRDRVINTLISRPEILIKYQK